MARKSPFEASVIVPRETEGAVMRSTMTYEGTKRVRTVRPFDLESGKPVTQEKPEPQE